MRLSHHPGGQPDGPHNGDGPQDSRINKSCLQPPKTYSSMTSEDRRPPFYIVGLPKEPIEASEARMKFERLSAELCKVYPFIEEIRAVVKSKKASKTHARYEVSVEVYTPRERHAFSETGYNLAAVFDSMGPRMKRLLLSKQSRVTAAHGESLRKRVEQD